MGFAETLVKFLQPICALGSFFSVLIALATDEWSDGNCVEYGLFEARGCGGSSDYADACDNVNTDLCDALVNGGGATFAFMFFALLLTFYIAVFTVLNMIGKNMLPMPARGHLIIFSASLVFVIIALFVWAVSPQTELHDLNNDTELSASWGISIIALLFLGVGMWTNGGCVCCGTVCSGHSGSQTTTTTTTTTHT